MADPRIVWSAQNVSKSFGPTRALVNATVSIRAGEIHGLIGENGAGKSTITKVATGVHRADSGTFRLNNTEYEPKSLLETANIGVSLIFQEITVNRMLTIAENVFISRLRRFRRGGLMDRRRINDEAQFHLDALGADFSVNDNIETLNLGQLKVIELARAIAEKPSMLFVDEATAVLDASGKELVLKSLRNLRDQGLAIGYVSHHFDEIFSLTDRMTIMRNGSNVATLETAKTDRHEIESLMVGRSLAGSMFPEKHPGTNEPLMSAENVSLADKIRNVSFKVNRGEVFGIAGLAGAGGSELLRILAGDLQLTQGTIELIGQDYKPKSPEAAMRRKVAYLPGDRDDEGLVGNFSVRENIGMSILPGSLNPVQVNTERKHVNHFINKLHIKTQNAEAQVDSLSGGNRQKVVLAKLLAINPDVLLLDNPTRGVDVGAREHLYSAIAEAARSGMSVILLSEDLSELLGLVNRLVVFRRGEISHEIDSLENISEREIISHML